MKIRYIVVFDGNYKYLFILQLTKHNWMSSIKLPFSTVGRTTKYCSHINKRHTNSRTTKHCSDINTCHTNIRRQTHIK